MALPNERSRLTLLACAKVRSRWNVDNVEPRGETAPFGSGPIPAFHHVATERTSSTSPEDFTDKLTDTTLRKRVGP
jgi:hypothetical protein